MKRLFAIAVVAAGAMGFQQGDDPARLLANPQYMKAATGPTFR